MIKLLLLLASFARADYPCELLLNIHPVWDIHDSAEGVIKLRDDELSQYRVHLMNGKIYDVHYKPITTRNVWPLFNFRGIWILDRLGHMYITTDQLKNYLEHSSLARHDGVICAGEIRVSKGTITFISNKSDRYGPTKQSFIRALRIIQDELGNRALLGADITTYWKRGEK